MQEFLNRAWPENDALLHELLELRREHARLLGYDGWPSYDAEVKMIGTGAAIPEFIERITEASRRPPAAATSTCCSTGVRQDHPEVTAVDSVDKAFYSEVLRRERFDVDAQEVRALLRLRQGAGGAARRDRPALRRGVRRGADAPRWHEDVTAYDVLPATADARLGRIHLDLHPRAGKYGHAAQFDLAPGIAGRQLAEGVLVCNFSRGLMEHDHVVTLFHEFGHLVHHVLAGGHAVGPVLRRRHRVGLRGGAVADAGGVGLGRRRAAVVRDRTPTASRSRASWSRRCARPTSSARASTPAPRCSTPRCPTGCTRTCRTTSPRRMRELQATYDVFGYVPDTHFHASFGHLEGYGSGYYTYMWSLVIAKDLFSAFDPDDLFDTEVAHRYRDRVLAPGGSRDAADLVADFLGRPYGFDAFERWLDARDARPPTAGHDAASDRDRVGRAGWRGDLGGR